MITDTFINDLADYLNKNFPDLSQIQNDPKSYLHKSKISRLFPNILGNSSVGVENMFRKPDVSPKNTKGPNEELAANYNILHSQFQKLLAERNDLEESLR